MTGWIEPKKLAIEHVRNCGEWMPVTRVRLGKGAHHSRDRQPTINRGIRVDVEIVIVIDKVAPDCRTENDAAEGKNSECQQPSVDAGVMTKPDVRFRHARYFSGRNLVVAARFRLEKEAALRDGRPVSAALGMATISLRNFGRSAPRRGCSLRGSNQITVGCVWLGQAHRSRGHGPRVRLSRPSGGLGHAHLFSLDPASWVRSYKYLFWLLARRAAGWTGARLKSNYC